MGKKFQNYRFRKTEEAIFNAFSADKKMPTPGVLARRAKISRSTLFRHYKTIYEIIPSYEKRIYRKYTKMMKVILEDKKAKIREVYLKILIFIVTNKKVLKAILKRKGGAIFEKMIWRLERRICADYFLPKKSEQIFGIYVKEIAGVLEEWGKQDFDKNEIEIILNKIMYLTDTIKTRLMLILKKC